MCTLTLISYLIAALILQLGAIRSRFEVKLEQVKNQLRSLSRTQLEQAKVAMQKIHDVNSSVKTLDDELRFLFSILSCDCLLSSTAFLRWLPVLFRFVKVDRNFIQVSEVLVRDISIIQKLEHVRKSIQDTKGEMKKIIELDSEVRAL